jgi:hypothetical protein
VTTGSWRAEEVAEGDDLLGDLFARALSNRKVGRARVVLERAQPATRETAPQDCLVELATAPSEPAQAEHNAAKARRLDERHHQSRLLAHQQQRTDHAQAFAVSAGSLDRFESGPLHEGQLLGGGGLPPQPRTGSGPGGLVGAPSQLGERCWYGGSVQVDRQQHAGRAVREDPDVYARMRPIRKPLVGVPHDPLCEELDESTDRQPCPRHLSGPGALAAPEKSRQASTRDGPLRPVSQVAAHGRKVTMCPS